MAVFWISSLLPHLILFLFWLSYLYHPRKLMAPYSDKHVHRSTRPWKFLMISFLILFRLFHIHSMETIWQLYCCENCIVFMVFHLPFQRYGGLSSFLGSDCITPSWKMGVWALLEPLCCILSLTSIIYDWFLANCQEDWQNTAGVSCDGLSYRLAGSSNIPCCFKVKHRSAESKGLGFDSS